MDPEELFPDAQKEESKLGALAPETGKLSRKESLMKSLAESLEASTAASGFAASPLAALAEKNEDAEEAGDDVIGDLPQSLLGRRTVSPDVESLLGPSSLPRSGATGVESLRQSLAASLEASASSVPLSPDTHSSPDADSVDRMQDFGLLKDADSVARLEHLGSRSSSKESESVVSAPVSATSRAKSKELLQKGSTASLLQNITGGAGGTRVHRLDREELKRLGQEIKDIHSTYQDKFVGKMDYFSLLSRMARIEEFMEHQLGRGGSVTSVIETLIKESRMHMAENEKLHRQMDELSKATVGNTSRIRDDSHRVENAADHAFRTAKHLEEVSNDFSVTKEVFREDVTRMAKAVQVLANEFRIFEEDNFKSNEKKAEQIGSAGDAIRELQKQIGKQELHGSTMEDGLEVIKQEVNSCAKEAGLKKLERRIMDMQEESARLQEFVHEKFFQIQDQERREMMAAFAARWDPYNRTRLLRKTMDGWVEFLRRQNKSREALARVKQIYAKTHVTARLRSWWYLMQRDHTDTQFKRLSENLETAEAKLEGTRGAVIRHEKATAEQARNLQYRLLAVEKGLETAEKEKATKHEVQESLDEIDRRLSEELSLDPVRRDLAEMKLHLKKLQDRQAAKLINGRDWKTTWEKEDKLDAAVADADREKVPCLYLHWMTLCEYGMSVVAKNVWKKTFGEMVDVSIQSMVAMDAQAMKSLKSEIPAILTFCYVGMAGICVCRLDADGLVLSGGFVGKRQGALEFAAARSRQMLHCRSAWVLPKAKVNYTGATGTLSCIRPIAEGEEIVVSYIDEFADVLSRRYFLLEAQGVKCLCPRCAANFGVGRDVLSGWVCPSCRAPLTEEAILCRCGFLVTKLERQKRQQQQQRLWQSLVQELSFLVRGQSDEDISRSMKMLTEVLEELRKLRPYGSCASIKAAAQLRRGYAALKRRTQPLAEWVRRMELDYCRELSKQHQMLQEEVNAFCQQPESPADALAALRLVRALRLHETRRLKRMGPRADGGYVVFDHGFRPLCKYLLSYGVGTNVDFEWELACSGSRVFLLDHTVMALPRQHPKFTFRQEAVAEQTLPGVTSGNSDK
ncbi:unnamed protein product, partial [Cladocopium goreaui]